MNSKRLKAIADFISKDDIVLDVGCDHGYLDIYLKENSLCKNVYASDISLNALNVAISNFKKRNLEIKTFLSDGFKDIPVFFNTAIIAGVGTNTIINILDYHKPDKLVLVSNKELYRLRKYLNEVGYKIIKENIVFEKKHYYVIIMCTKGLQKLNEYELKFGISNDYEYLKYLLNKNRELFLKTPDDKKEELESDSKYLQSIIEKK